MSYNGAHIVNYTHINSRTGSGFILSRLRTALTGLTKRDVYDGTRYGKWVEGYHSSLWAKLLDDGLIIADGGRQRVAIPYNMWHSLRTGEDSTTLRAMGCRGDAPRYFITDKGISVYNSMMIRESRKH